VFSRVGFFRSCLLSNEELLSFVVRPSRLHRAGGTPAPQVILDIRLPLCGFRYREISPMKKLDPSVPQQFAQAAIAFQKQRTGHEPQSVAVVLSGETLLITLHGALSQAEKEMAKSEEGAAQVQDFHRQLFTNSAEELRQEIKRITGVEVREATAEVETTTGTVVQVFTSGTMVQVFLLAKGVPSESWSGNGSDMNVTKTEVLKC
jgi:uncharacterized protein YbcI